MQTVALGILVFARTDQPAWTGLVAAAGFLPIGLLAPLGGALADRLDRRRWLILTTLAEMSFAAVLAVLAATGHDPPGRSGRSCPSWAGRRGPSGSPPTRPWSPTWSPPRTCSGAVSLSSAQFNLGRVIGPALAGLALLTHDYGLVFGINAASFGAVVVALVLVRLPKPIPAPVTHRASWPAIVAGARAAMAEPGCRAAIELIAVVALLASPFIALVPAMAGVRRTATGSACRWPRRILVTAQGIGAVAGALALPVAGRAGRAGAPCCGRPCSSLPVLLVALRAGPDAVAGRPWPSWPWGPATSPCCPDSTPWSSCGPRPRPGAGS